MGSGENSNLSDAERKKLLEDIRRRAEQDELERLEQDEEFASESEAPFPEVTPVEPPGPPAAAPGPGPSERREPAPPPSPAAPVSGPDVTGAPAPPPATGPAADVSEERIAILKERLTIAIDRGKADRASSILSELRHLVPDEPSLPDYESRLAALTDSALPAAPGPPRPASLRKARGASRKSAAELLEQAYSLYQQEKYDRALDQVAEILEVEPENGEAAELRERIEKAKQISDLIRSEEQQQRAGEAIGYPEPEVPPAVGGDSDRDFWGAETVPAPTDGLDLPPEETGPVAPPKQPVAERLVEQISRVRVPWKPIAVAGLIVLVGILGYLAIDPIKQALAPQGVSLVVLPPVTQGEEPGTRHIADGILQDLIADLAMASDLRVTAASTALVYRASSAPPRVIARAVGAGRYLQWSISRPGEKLVLQTSLFDTNQTKPIWSARTETTPRELAGARVELARRILDALELHPVPGNEPMLQRVPTRSAPAYDSYLRGRDVFRRSGRRDAPALAASWYADAIAKDSAFADAHAALGWVTMLTYEASWEPQPQYIAQALGSIQRAMRLGLKNSEVFRAWSLIEMYRGQTAKMMERAEDAVRVGPSDAEAQRRLAVLLVARREYDRALAVAGRAAELDPGNEASHTVLGNIHQFIGQFVQTGADARASLDAALRAYERGLQLAADRSAYGAGVYSDLLVAMQRPEQAEELLLDRSARIADDYVEHYKLARVKQAAGHPKDAWTRDLLAAQSLLQARLLQVPGDAVAHAYLALTYTRLGQFKEAISANRRASELSPSATDVHYLTARMFALQREKSQALEALEKGLTARYSLPDLLDMDLYNLRSDEGLLPIIARQ